MVIPELFVMWDEKISENYGCSRDAEGYFEFLCKMKAEANEIIKTYSEDKKIGKIEAKKKICEIKTLPKLIDEYNYMSR